VGAASAMVASVLLRALLYTGAVRRAGGDGLAGFHARVWPAVPAGALAGGLGAEAVGVAGLVTAAGLVVAAAALAAFRLPAPRQPLAAAAPALGKMG
ncbi:MAG TPA: hypothetical protein VNT56_01070, partial [Acidimicrobiales bacterium]|nr:hypothetical protein [Acidimicrobiales bacterium]